MKKTLLISAIVLGVLLLAVGGWTVKGMRRVARAGRPRLRPAYAS